jgi:hypothetical protein
LPSPQYYTCPVTANLPAQRFDGILKLIVMLRNT